jgi:hypothetical protein
VPLDHGWGGGSAKTCFCETTFWQKFINFEGRGRPSKTDGNEKFYNFFKVEVDQAMTVRKILKQKLIDTRWSVINSDVLMIDQQKKFEGMLMTNVRPSYFFSLIEGHR